MLLKSLSQSGAAFAGSCWHIHILNHFRPFSLPLSLFSFLLTFIFFFFFFFYRQVVKSDGVKEEGELLQTRNGERMKRSNFFLLMAKGFSSAFAATHNRRGGQFHQHFTSNFFILRYIWALEYFSGPWENILALWQYLKIILFQITNKTALT